jgi:hypothetical protein
MSAHFSPPPVFIGGTQPYAPAAGTPGALTSPTSGGNTVIWSTYEPFPHFTPSLWFPVLYPSDEYADFSYEASNDVAGDSIVALTFRSTPGGEVTAARLTLTGTLVTVWLKGGVPGRSYMHELTLSTAALRNLPVLLGQVCRPVLAACPAPPPLNPGWGATSNWP